MIANRIVKRKRKEINKNTRNSNSGHDSTNNIPIDIGNVFHMERLVRILVALTLKANLVVATAICKGEHQLEESEGPRRKRQRRN